MFNNPPLIEYSASNPFSDNSITISEILSWIPQWSCYLEFPTDLREFSALTTISTAHSHHQRTPPGQRRSSTAPPSQILAPYTLHSSEVGPGALVPDLLLAVTYFCRDLLSTRPTFDEGFQRVQPDLLWTRPTFDEEIHWSNMVF